MNRIFDVLSTAQRIKLTTDDIFDFLTSQKGSFKEKDEFREAMEFYIEERKKDKAHLGDQIESKDFEKFFFDE